MPVMHHQSGDTGRPPSPPCGGPGNSYQEQPMTIPDDTATIARRHERHVETPHGRVYVTEIPGGDPPIVLMHGFPDDHRIYNKLLPRLPPRRAVAFHFAGYGRAGRKDGTHFSPAEP